MISQPIEILRFHTQIWLVGPEKYFEKKLPLQVCCGDKNKFNFEE